MVESSNPLPLEVTEAVGESLDEERVAVRISGTWHRVPAEPQRLMLIVDADGRRHRFPAAPAPRMSAGAGPGQFAARFMLPAGLAHELNGQMTLLVGETMV